MTPSPFADPTTPAIPILIVTADTWPDVEASLTPVQTRFATAAGFEPKAGRHCLLPAENGSLALVLFAVAEPSGARADPFAVGALPELLPAGTYRFDAMPDGVDPGLAALGFGLGAYRFERYKAGAGKEVRLAPPGTADAADLARVAAAVAFGRDLVNTPANDLGPDELEAAAHGLARRHGATLAVTSGEALAAGFPLIHAVGCGSDRPPRLLDLAWGDPAAPKVTLVGKGVVFDTGGLDIKPPAGMLLMKKDMGGAAAALAAADMVMGAGLAVRLRVLVPVVENAISGRAFRPGDVLRSRKGLTVEIGNTDAEGRLILADALALADEEAPELVVDFATLTGAARVALGPDLPPAFTHDEALAADLGRIGAAVHDPVWRLPLWPPYDRMLDSKIADLNNAPAGGFAGAITAALFLFRFVSAAAAHLHFDVYGWTPSRKPGRPEGGEVQTARLVYALLRERYGARAA